MSAPMIRPGSIRSYEPTGEDDRLLQSHLRTLTDVEPLRVRFVRSSEPAPPASLGWRGLWRGLLSWIRGVAGR